MANEFGARGGTDSDGGRWIVVIGDRGGVFVAGGASGSEQETLNVKTLAEYFTKLTHLPRLSTGGVIPGAVAAGVRRGLFAYVLGDAEAKQFDTICFSDKTVGAVDCEVTETAWLVCPALAKTLIPEPEQKPVTTGTGTSAGTGTTTVTGGGSTGGRTSDDEWTGKGGKVVIKEGERRLNKVRVEIKNLPWENWHDIYNEVIQPLANEGAEVHCQLVVIAKGDAAIRENTVELGIKESLGQRDIQAEIQTG